MPDSSDALVRALSYTLELLEGTQDPWWIIGGAAFVLVQKLSPDVSQVKDVDVIVSRRDAEAIAMRTGLPNTAGAGTGMFSSDTLLKDHSAGLPIEIMAGLKVRGLPVRPVTRQCVVLGKLRLPVPKPRELIRILRIMGRPKDLRRARYLERLAR